MSGFRVHTLVSGSSGNAVYAECADGAVLVDAGMSGKACAEAIAEVGGDIARVRALFLTHDHSDHSRGCGVLARRHGMGLYMSAGSRDRCDRLLRKTAEPEIVIPGEHIAVGGFIVQTLATPHDAGEPMAVVLERGGFRCGVLTDLGHPFAGLSDLLGTLDAVILESNFDPEMLADGPYPYWLQKRIRSDHGHIANAEAAELLSPHVGERLRTVHLAHLSENNNSPEVALATARARLNGALDRPGVHLTVAPRHRPGPAIPLEPSPRA